MTERLLLCDSNSLIYRGYFAIPPLTTTKGELVNAAFGFASILLKVLQEHPIQHIAACFDLPVPTFRKERDATYKATRKPMPDDLRPQFERCKEFLDKFGVPMFSVPQKAIRRVSIAQDTCWPRVVVDPGMRRSLLHGNREISIVVPAL